MTRSITWILSGVVWVVASMATAQTPLADLVAEVCSRPLSDASQYASELEADGWRQHDISLREGVPFLAVSQGIAISTVFGDSPAPVWARQLETARRNLPALANRQSIDGSGVGIFSFEDAGARAWLQLDVSGGSHRTVECDLFFDTVSAQPIADQWRSAAGGSLADQPFRVPLNTPPNTTDSVIGFGVSGSVLNPDTLPDLLGEPLLIGLVLSYWVSFPASVLE